MIKFEYKVLKPFMILDNGEGNKQISDEVSDNRSGIIFNLADRYIDYEYAEQDIKQDPFTQKLLDKNYLELIQTIKLSVPSN